MSKIDTLQKKNDKLREKIYKALRTEFDVQKSRSIEEDINLLVDNEISLEKECNR